MKKIAVFGLWHQGIVAAACLAEKSFEVTAYDVNDETIETLNSSRSPIYEPGLDDLIKKNISKNLYFQNLTRFDGKNFDLLLIALDTKIDDKDLSDLSEFFYFVKTISKKISSQIPIVITSQLPVGTCSQILKDNLEPTQPIGYFPENLQLGKAIERFMNPQLPVIGSNDPNFLIKIKVFLNVFNNKFSLVNLETAEMLKHSLNAFNALTISFGNEIGELSEKLGANALEVCQLLKLEPRVGEHCMIKPGLAFAGGTLARDVQSLRSLGINNSISTPLLDGIWKRNQIQNQQLLKKIDKFFGKRNDLTITILGLTYKAGTDTLRRSASIELVREIQYKYQHIRLHDPKINSINFDEFGLKEDTVILTQNITEACHNSDAIILMTPWAEYKAIDFKSLTRFFNGSLIIDPHNIWSTHKAPDNIYIDFFGK